MTREETKKRFQSWCQGYIGNNASDEDYQMFNNIMALLEQEPKTGHWIYEKRKRLINETDEGAEYAIDYWCKCSKCGGDFGYRKMKDAFCKYCGARMVEPQESEDKK